MAKKISVIIPNFNGEDLLKKNLPQVIKSCPDCEVIVVDDKSTDNSASLIKKKFKDVILIENAKNEGFAKSVNTGVRESKGDLVLLLNSDVSPREDFLDKAIKHFNNRHLFAVGLADFSHENGKIVKRGRGGAIFKNGFVNHFMLPSIKGKTLWVSGGSGLFDKEKFVALGGFDPIYAPFYWEDIDLSFRTWRAGFKCIFEPESKVDHFHEKGAIKKKYSEFYVKTVSYKNQFLFVWKNIDDYFLIAQHILWQPYHFIKAVINVDLAFFAGFFWALLKLPSLIFNYEPSTINYKLPDKEVLKKFAKQ